MLELPLGRLRTLQGTERFPMQSAVSVSSLERRLSALGRFYKNFPQATGLLS
jgi:hypothetical protein